MFYIESQIKDDPRPLFRLPLTFETKKEAEERIKYLLSKFPKHIYRVVQN